MRLRVVIVLLIVLLNKMTLGKTAISERKLQNTKVVRTQKTRIVKLEKSYNLFFALQSYDDSCPTKCECYSDNSVNCSRSGLTDIPKLPSNVTALDVSGNLLKTIKDGAFRGLHFLKSIDFSSNPLTDESFSENSFVDVDSLETLYFGQMSFKKIPNNLPENITSLYVIYSQVKSMNSSYLTRYKRLQLLDLSQNHMTSVVSDLNKLFPIIKSFDASFNKITNKGIYSTSFKNCTQLDSLSFRFNQLTQIPKNLPISLENLDLVGNPISVLQKYAFQKLHKLQTLQIWESGLKRIEDFAFRGLSQLTILDMMECHVTTAITNNTFSGLSKINTIDLSLSNISVMESGSLMGMNKLQQLWLNDNPLTTLDPLVFANTTIPSISIIYLWGSNWNCDCKLKWLKEMQENGPIIQDPHLMVCAQPEALKGKAWDTISSSQFQCYK